MKLDIVTLEVIRNALPAMANEMAADLQRTSYNMMIYEVRDFCTALVNVEGELVSQNVGGVSHFVADLGVIITDAVKRYGKKGFKPGDVIITNHQAVAGQHLNNVVIYVPYFFKGELLASTAVWKLVMSSVPWNPTSKDVDSWQGFQTEQHELVSFIESKGITGVLFASGDMHSGGGIDDGTTSFFPRPIARERTTPSATRESPAHGRTASTVAASGRVSASSS